MLTTLGLRASTFALPVANYGPYFLLGNFFLSYVLTTTRFSKTFLGVDNNISPRYDLNVHADKYIKDGKMTQKQLDALRRMQSAHENSMEHFPVFAAAVLSAIVGGVDAQTLNFWGLGYTVVRAAYCYVYRCNETRELAGVRSVLWWCGNVACMRLLWLAGKSLNKAI